eukprot:Mrub_03536.p1 GENE.Mrub_03536~~Mrub_03536.p1  ORF type:complete len:477 (-),score=41.68 Mrub_03536:6-1331(-)
MIIGIICWIFGYGKYKLDKDLDMFKFSSEYYKPEIHIRFVSKGINPQQICDSLIDIQEVVTDDRVKRNANWYVEVVTDNYMDLGPKNANVHQIVVPQDYVCPKRTLFKARALHYASCTVDTDQNAWIIHMDEESYFDVENASKLVDFCDNENFLIKYKNQAPSFANGPISYFKNESIDNLFISLVDAVRTGEDLFKYQWSYPLFNKCYLGIKGSNWIIHSEIERNHGFDVGLNRSVGEDWACSLTFNNLGYPIKWAPVQVQEQSPFNFYDFMKQRNRWQKSIFLNAINSPELSYKLKFFLMYNTFCFLGAPLGIVSIIIFYINVLTTYYRGYNLIPMIGDQWLQDYFKLVSFVFWLVYFLGFCNSGIHKCGLGYFIFGFIYYLSPVGYIVAGMTENATLCYFVLFVDKFKLEFKVINKDKKPQLNAKQEEEYNKLSLIESL